MIEFGGCALALVLLLLAWLTARYSLFVPARRGLPVLMYHHVHPSRKDALTVTVEQFGEQLAFLAAAGYEAISCRQLIDHLDRGAPLPERPVLLTFDDGYVDNVEHAYPLLRQYRFRATLFVPVGLLGQTNRWDDGREPLLTVRALAELDPAVMELGLHSWSHEDYRRMNARQIGADAGRCLAGLAADGLPCVPVLAYPYGRYPREPGAAEAAAAELLAAGVRCALRIGNRLNRLPLTRRFELQRINIKGTDSAWEFRTKVRKGRVKLF